MGRDMIEDKSGGPAFPEPGLSNLPNGEFIYGQSGMTLRDYFAAKAMQGILAGDHPITHDEDPLETVAEAAYHQADAMIKARGL